MSFFGSRAQALLACEASRSKNSTWFDLTHRGSRSLPEERKTPDEMREDYSTTLMTLTA